jgi:citrate synthase
LRILEVKPQTLYSYVSRGLIRRLNTPNGRISYYNRQDIERRKARSVARSGHGPAAASAIHWGEPLLTTAITEITDQGPRYRGRLATDLARDNVPYESVAGYLWTGRLVKRSTWPVARQEPSIANELCKVVSLHPGMHIRQLLTEIVWLHGMKSREQAHAGEERALSLRLLRDMTAAFGLLGPRRSFAELRAGEGIASGLARALGVAPHPVKLCALNAALVLVADHELTPATFAARIAASTGSDLYSCVAAAIQVQFGTALGLRCDRLEQRLEPTLLSSKGGPDEVLRNARVPHELGVPIYPKGDPRAKMLVELALRIWAASEGPTVTSIRETVSQDHFILDEGLVILCRALGVQQQAAGGLLALGRTAGWIAHVLEQRQEQFVIRPRGKFVPEHIS